MNIILLSIAAAALVAGTVTDIRTREVPDWINYALIFSGIGLRLLYSAIASEWRYLLEGIAGFAIFLVIGYIMFYAGQWGGGDSKMMMGLGAVIGFSFSWQPFPLLLVFFLNILVAGSIYGLVYSIVLAVKYKKSFVKEFRKKMKDDKMHRFRRIKLALLMLAVVAMIILLKAGVLNIVSSALLLALVIIVYLSFYMLIFVKAVESAVMIKQIPPEMLTEGDWIAKDVVVRGRRIVGPKELGVEKKHIKEMVALKEKGKLKTVWVKYGIPFVPSFLVAYIASLMFGAWWLNLI